MTSSDSAKPTCDSRQKELEGDKMKKPDTDQVVRKIVERVRDEIGLAYARRAEVTRFSLEKAVRRALTETGALEERDETPEKGRPER